jgi:hypothetical protein
MGGSYSIPWCSHPVKAMGGEDTTGWNMNPPLSNLSCAGGQFSKGVWAADSSIAGNDAVLIPAVPGLGGQSHGSPFQTAKIMHRKNSVHACGQISNTSAPSSTVPALKWQALGPLSAFPGILPIAIGVFTP